MRPRFMNRGSAAVNTVNTCEYLASMRPRFMNRGSRLALRKTSQAVAASMRPRFMNRGSDGLHAEADAKIEMLQ